MSYGSTDATTSNSNTVTQAEPMYLPGQASYLPSYISQFQNVAAGNYSGSPIYNALNQAGQDSAGKAAAGQAAQISSAGGVSSPAKAAALNNLGTSTTEAAANASTSGIQSMLGTLQKYALAAPSIGVNTTSSTTSGGGGGSSESLCCFIFIEADDLTERVRQFRDAHFFAGGSVDRGYRKMASWLVRKMKEYPWLKRFVKAVMTKPLGRVADWTFDRDKHGWICVPVAYFWIGMWSIYGGLGGKVHSKSMTRTFIKRALGV